MPYPFVAGEILTATNLNNAVEAVKLGEANPTNGISVTFSSIPATFDHLCIVLHARHDNASAANVHRNLGLRFNGDTAGNYNELVHDHNGAGTLTTRQNDAVTFGSVGLIGDVMGSAVIDIPNYRSGVEKVAHGDGASRIANSSATTNWRRYKGMMLWTGTAAITSVTVIFDGTDAFAGAGNIITLYGRV